MTGDLRVTTAHLLELAAKQRHAASEIKSAAQLADGVDTSVRLTHGVISWSTAGAVEAVLNARRSADTSIEGVSEGMADSLESAAAAYDRIDGMVGGRLDDRMQPR
jgi:hypothetical protein